MRKVMDIVFAEGNRLGIPVVLDTDAKSKCERDQHLGMELAVEVPFGDFTSSSTRTDRHVFSCSTCCRVAISRWKLFFQ